MFLYFKVCSSSMFPLTQCPTQWGWLEPSWAAVKGDVEHAQWWYPNIIIIPRKSSILSLRELNCLLCEDLKVCTLIIYARNQTLLYDCIIFAGGNSWLYILYKYTCMYMYIHINETLNRAMRAPQFFPKILWQLMLHRKQWLTTMSA